MAALSVAAHTARVDARRLRHESESLRLRVRGNLARSRERLGRAQVEASRARAQRDELQPSPWSELRWTQTYETLEQTLVPVPLPPADR